MEIRSGQPVPAVSASPETGRHRIISSVPQVEASAAPKATPTPHPSQQLAHTRQVIAEQVRQYLHATARNVEFQVDSESNQAVIVVRDAEGNVIRRIPGEEALRWVQQNAQSGTLVDSIA